MEAKSACFIKQENINQRGIFNVGSNEQNFKIIEIGNLVKKEIPETNVIVNKASVDKRDYNVNFDKITNIGYKTNKTVKDAINEMKILLESEEFDYNDSLYNNFQYLKERGIK